MLSAGSQGDGRVGEQICSEEVCLARRFPPETLHGGRVGVKEAEAGVGNEAFERRAEGRRKGWTL